MTAKAQVRPRVEVSADLRFSIEVPGHPAVEGTVVGSGNRLEVRLSDPAYFAGGRDARNLRGFAAALASQGITVVVVARDVVLLEVGVTDPSWWQRRLTKSRHLKVVSVRGAVTGAVGRVRGSTAASVLPGSELLPPRTLFPVAPTFGPSNRRITTTHDPRRGGNPRLSFTTSNPRLPSGAQITFPLRSDVTTIGSDSGCDICLPNLEAMHAAIVHDSNDEFVLNDHSSNRSTLLNGAYVLDGRVLRTGARLSIGPWTLAYRRAEFADHGRPFGGRIGGEAGHQRPQPQQPQQAQTEGSTKVVLGPGGPQ